MRPVAAILETPTAQKLMFSCPGCRCSHAINVKLKNCSEGPLWSWNGSLERPTITPSILVTYGREPRPHRPQTCHSFVTDGRIQFLGDCEHTLAGQTVDLQPID
jgi:hypothetical protein